MFIALSTLYVCLIIQEYFLHNLLPSGETLPVSQTVTEQYLASPNTLGETFVFAIVIRHNLFFLVIT